MELYANFFAYLGVGLALLTTGIILFVWSTPKIKEFSLISQKNLTAAMSLGGKIIGLALVLGAAAEFSVSLLDMAIWGTIGILAQIAAFNLAEIITIRYSISKAIEEDNRAVGAMLFSLSISIGWIVSKCLSY
ncbi:DUF350 domain-containing protein [Bacillus sp. EB01]|jgi:putative membrane protein|uniref:DUF350 domain-containing protein n=1 Tax=Bacillus sp. EB01 TaxID=1347086 RepID=UPI0005C794CD|nr:DUF350 domain-containing protein [Bacillus sp. EB01]